MSELRFNPGNLPLRWPEDRNRIEGIGNINGSIEAGKLRNTDQTTQVENRLKDLKKARRRSNREIGELPRGAEKKAKRAEKKAIKTEIAMIESRLKDSQDAGNFLNADS